MGGCFVSESEAARPIKHIIPPATPTRKIKSQVPQAEAYLKAHLKQIHEGDLDQAIKDAFIAGADFKNTEIGAALAAGFEAALALGLADVDWFPYVGPHKQANKKKGGGD